MDALADQDVQVASTEVVGRVAEAAGQDEAQLLRAAVEGGLDGLVVVSADGVMISSNRRFQQMWPIPPEVLASGDDRAALESVLDKLVDPEAFLARVHALYAGGEGSGRDELRLLDGRVFDRYGTTLPAPDGRYLGWAWYFRDVTADRAAAVDAGRLSALMTVAQVLADARSEVDVLSVVDGRGASVLGAQGAALCLLEPGGRSVRTLATTFFDESLRADAAVLPVEADLPLVHAAVTGTPLFLADRAEGLRSFPGAREVYVRARTEATAVVPMVVHGTTIGSLAVASERPHSWSTADRALLAALAALTAQALDRLRAHQAEREATREIHRLSETLQRSLLTPPPRWETVELAARYQPAARNAEVGGDWYDAFRAPGGTMVLVVGDVVGHDSTAAAAMAQVRNVLRGVAQTLRGGPGDVLSALDGALDRVEMGTLATAVLCQASPDPTDGGEGRMRLRWANAGHPPPLVVHADGRVEVLAHRPELLLGVRPDTARTDHEVSLEPGATLLLYTDGLVERRGQSLDDGTRELVRTAGELAGYHVEDLCEALLEKLATGSDDDVVLFAARVLGAPGGGGGQ